jgi:ubiquinone/menaquinone biosynthesis C-methylase UbiE
MPDEFNSHQVASSYDRWAKSYESDPNRTRDLASKCLRDVLSNIQGTDIIEVGCGTGYNTRWLANYANSVRAIDISPGMLVQARRNVSSQSVQFLQHDITRAWPLEDQSADYVLAVLVMEHIEQLELVFKEAVRTLRPGGTFLMIELHPARQYAGGQAQFTDSTTGVTEKIRAFVHNVSDYINPALELGLQLDRLGEWRDDADTADGAPRLLSASFRKSLTN